MAPAVTRPLIAAEELAELVAVEAKIKKATAELKAIVLARGSHLMDLHASDPSSLPGSWQRLVRCRCMRFGRTFSVR